MLPHRRDGAGHGILDAPFALQHHERGERAGIRIVGRPIEVQGIVRSVRSDTLLTNASFCRSDPIARLSASCFSRMASDRRWKATAFARSPPPHTSWQCCRPTAASPVVRPGRVLPDAQRSTVGRQRPRVIAGRTIDVGQVGQDLRDVRMVEPDDPLSDRERTRLYMIAVS